MTERIPSELARSGDRELTLTWDDEHVGVSPTPGGDSYCGLRQRCPCDVCDPGWAG